MPCRITIHLLSLFLTGMLSLGCAKDPRELEDTMDATSPDPAAGDVKAVPSAR